MVLTPPPDPDHAVSELIAPAAAEIEVPPHPTTKGLDAGKSTLRPARPSPEPLSPDATNTGIPTAAAA
jgi:hypothetical protein